mmetsp:Transcript_66743/g.186065  ORF Transcript_66743/g.186065 Transcript_66743/m.186065 type:complete len:206 (+) Transcript_66743:785-1402(+)
MLEANNVIWQSPVQDIDEVAMSKYNRVRCRRPSFIAGIFKRGAQTQFFYRLAGRTYLAAQRRGGGLKRRPRDRRDVPAGLKTQRVEALEEADAVAAVDQCTCEGEASRSSADDAHVCHTRRSAATQAADPASAQGCFGAAAAGQASRQAPDAYEGGGRHPCTKGQTGPEQDAYARHKEHRDRSSSMPRHEARLCAASAVYWGTPP